MCCIFIGDAGNVSDTSAQNHAPLLMLKKELAAENEKATVVFLGDNIYPNGLRKKNHRKRADSEYRLNAQLDVLKGFPGKSFFVPGNHDWNGGKKNGGLKSVQRQEKYIQHYFKGQKAKLHPSDGCGDPKKVKLNDKMTLIFLDSQWWIQDWDELNKINKGCEVKSRAAFLEALEELILQNKNKQIVLLMHHPLISNGNHGGHFSGKQHIFPFTKLNKKLYLPLPVLGSIYPLHTKMRRAAARIWQTLITNRLLKAWKKCCINTKTLFLPPGTNMLCNISSKTTITTSFQVRVAKRVLHARAMMPSLFIPHLVTLNCIITKTAKCGWK